MSTKNVFKSMTLRYNSKYPRACPSTSNTLSYLAPPDAPPTLPALLAVLLDGCWRPLEVPASVWSRLASADGG